MKRFLPVLAFAGLFIPDALTAQDVDPTGLYEWEVDAGGEYVTGIFQIEKAEDTWTGTAVSNQEESSITRIRVLASVVSFTVKSASYGDVYVELRVDGERFTGFATVGGEQVPMNGTKSGG